MSKKKILGLQHGKMALTNRKKKSFSVRKYHEAQAKQMAINHRQQIEKTLPHYILAFGNEGYV